VREIKIKDEVFSNNETPRMRLSTAAYSKPTVYEADTFSSERNLPPSLS
jgi:hypothetical protein